MIVVVTYFSNLNMWAKGSAAVRKREQGGRAKNEPISSNSPLKKLRSAVEFSPCSCSVPRCM